jgi:hypothetical protein
MAAIRDMGQESGKLICSPKDSVILLFAGPFSLSHIKGQLENFNFKSWYGFYKSPIDML